MEADTIKRVEMKNKIQKEYLRRTRKLLETKLSSRNLIKGINNWAVSLVRYSGPFLKWTRDELKQMDQRTRKLINMHKTLHLRDDVDRLICIKKRGRNRTCQYWWQCWRIDRTTQGQHRKTRRRTHYSHWKRYWQHDGQQNDNWETKMGRKTILCFKRLIKNISHEKTWNGREKETS